ncbi:hypothetical protein [Brevibacillus choshinensis]|uniref:Uncharacterized protein n=1 Tax=Brevibacillus choshinensis TaxID=54911 RepID=A0ABX7FR08_BRECH|nr:hypothetical protein [Brevibacillus choshinensis]QRG68034.1 hypothetical protein JNE38_02155 [Brevibacillus choshinensis]
MPEKRPKQKQKEPPEYFYFDLSSEGNQRLLQHELEEAEENPLSPLEEVTKIEY